MNPALAPTAVLVGHLAPGFELRCTSASGHTEPMARLAEYRGRWLILMFYPRDFSLVCPTELLAMNNRYEEFVELGADVLAVSTDSLENHERWIATPRAEGGLGSLKFPLASDSGGDVARAYHACLDPQCVALRGLFIIDPNGVVQYQVVQNLSVGRRSDEVVRVLTALQTGGLCGESWSPGHQTLDVGTLKAGNVVSHYRIRKKIGDGGFASVYLARDLTLERHVALKIMKRTQEWAPSILSEARAAAALNHPNVCTVYGIDDSEGMLMIVMEHLVGRVLKDLLDEGPTSAPSVARIGRQIASGMAAAHEAGIVHGDLKPANIILTDDGTAKILDFGLAARHAVMGSGDGTASCSITLPLETSEGPRFAGTPGYMAPEKVEGGPATTSSDVFSFGLILYELLTGKRAFEGSNMLQILTRIRSIDPEGFAREVQEPFGSLLRSMLTADPSLRTITMAAVAEQLAEKAVS